MANTNAPFGLRQTGYAEGQAPTFGMSNFGISSADTNAIGWGDPVKLDSSTGLIQRWTAGTSSVLLAGVFVGCEYMSTSGTWTFSNWWPGGGAASNPIAKVIPATQSSAQFLIQATTTATSAMIWANADLTMGSVNTTTGMSGAALNSASVATTATFPLKIVSLYGTPYGLNAVGPGSDSASANNWVVVRFNSDAILGG